MFRPVFALLLCVLFSLTGCEQETRIYLYGQFYYGMTYEDVQQETQSTYCADDLNQLCRPNLVPFFRESWQQRFYFRRDRLIAVELTHHDLEKARPLVDSWLDSGYRYLPVSISSAGQELDLFAEIRRYGKEGARQAVHAFTRATAQDRETTYLYLDLDRREDLLNSMNSLAMIFATAPRDLVGIEETVNEHAISIRFCAPIAEWQDRRMQKR